MIDWFAAILGGVGFAAGAIGFSARPGDRLQDIPRVFMRRPVTIVVGALAFASVQVLLDLVGR